MAATDDVPLKFGCYERGKELGRGTFGRVYSCRRDGAGKTKGAEEWFAAKAIDLRRLRLSRNVSRELKKLKREADILKKLPPHPRLVSLLDIVVEQNNWAFFVLELVPGGDLLRALFKRPGKRPRLQEIEALFVFRQLVEGLELLHGQGIIHRDLKLENVLVVRERAEGSYLFLDVKITDFGLSKIVGEGFSDACSTVGSPRYMAPEVVTKGIHDFRADLWSLGIMLYVMLDGRFPSDEPKKAQQSEINELISKLPASAQARSVVSGLLQKNLEKRTAMEQLVQDPWLSSAGTAAGRTPAARPRGRINKAELIQEDEQKGTAASKRHRLRLKREPIEAASPKRRCIRTKRSPALQVPASKRRRLPAGEAAALAEGSLFSKADHEAVTAATDAVSKAVSSAAAFK